MKHKLHFFELNSEFYWAMMDCIGDQHTLDDYYLGKSMYISGGEL